MNSDSGVLKWGILGCGAIAHDFVLALQSLETTTTKKVVACGSRSVQRASAFGTAHNIKKTYGSYEELVKDEEVDIIYIATAIKFHRLHAELAMRNGKHVLVEKAITVSVDEMKQLAKTAHDTERFCMEGMWTKFFPAFRCAQNIVKSGEIGEVKILRSDLHFDLEKATGPDEQRWKEHAIFDLGIYPIHVAVAFFGTEKPLSVQSLDQFHHKTGKNVETACTIQFASGQQAQLTWGYLTDIPETTEIIGTKGIVRIHGPAHCPTKISVMKVTDPTNEVIHQFDLPKVAGTFNYTNSEGFVYEIVAVEKCLTQGNKECENMSLTHSLQAQHICRLIMNNWD